MLDPSQRNLSVVQDFLVAQETTAFNLLSQAMDKYTDGQQALDASEVNHAASSGEAVYSPVPSVPWKKAKIDLLSKHVYFTGTVDREIQMYRCLPIAPDDVLAWWKSQKDTYPRLSLLARTILAIPATSAPSERVFSTAGLTVNAKRSSLAPSTVDKVVFIHENAISLMTVWNRPTLRLHVTYLARTL